MVLMGLALTTYTIRHGPARREWPGWVGMALLVGGVTVTAGEM